MLYIDRYYLDLLHSDLGCGPLQVAHLCGYEQFGHVQLGKFFDIPLKAKQKAAPGFTPFVFGLKCGLNGLPLPLICWLLD